LDPAAPVASRRCPEAGQWDKEELVQFELERQPVNGPHLGGGVPGQTIIFGQVIEKNSAPLFQVVFTWFGLGLRSA
jgi:hypothetical protein